MRIPEVVKCPRCKNDNVEKSWCSLCEGVGLVEVVEKENSCPNFPSPCFCDGSCKNKESKSSVIYSKMGF